MNTLMQTRGLTKVYDMGEIQVQSLRGADLDLFEGRRIHRSSWPFRREL